MSKRQRTEDENHKQNDSRAGLKHHERFDYTPITKRGPNCHWPNESRLAVYIAVNLEHFEFGKGLGAKLAPSSEPDILNYSWREYGNRYCPRHQSVLAKYVSAYTCKCFPRNLHDLTPELLAELGPGDCLTC